jgi:hypothetical protein
MSSIIQLDEMIAIETPIGNGYAIIFETGEHDNYWTVIMDNGAFVTFAQKNIRAKRCYTHGRNLTDDEMKDIIKVKNVSR